MSSIRPLITITILVVVGAYLFMKINSGPARLAPEAESALESAPPIGIPPLASAPTDTPAIALPTVPLVDNKSTPTSEPTPQWANDGPVSAPITEPVAAPISPVATASNLPPIPELPPLASKPAAIAESQPLPVAQPASPPIQLPANIPMAKYPGEAEAIGQTPPETAMTPPFALPDATLVTADDRYGPIPAEPPTSPTTAPEVAPAASQSSFATSWPIIQGALERQELVEGYDMLSQWYGNPSLSPAEADQVESLLSQLAGTVVYSTEHRLEPPYTVHAGDTLQTIAQQYEIPWQLLAKINGVPAADMVQPGQQLKVIHGPFAAIVELQKSQLTLVLAGRYAGRFPITLEPTAPQSEGEWVLEQKLVNPSAAATGVVAASYDSAAVDRVLVLRNESANAGGTTISITGGPVSPSGPTAIAPAAFRLSTTDAEEVADILSVGSRVSIRR